MFLLLLVTSTILVCGNIGFTAAASNKSRLCFKGSESDIGNTTLECPKGQVISIDEALFGRNKWGACVISDEDCVEKTKIFHECENLNNCTKTFKTYSMLCGYATVMFISYTCLQVDHVATYTSTSTATLTTKKAGNYVGPQIHVTTRTSGLVSGNNGDNLNEAGLIAGCVVAAVITVIALVIAITMVIRHLLQKNNPDDEDDDDQDSLQSKGNICCICIDCFSWLTTKFSAHKKQHRLKVAKKTLSSPSVSISDKTESACKEKSSTFSTENMEGVDIYPVSGDGCENIQLSAKVLTPLDTTTNTEEISGGIDKLDSNSNSQMKFINTIKAAYCNDGMENSPEGTIVLNDNSKNNHTELEGDGVCCNSVKESTGNNITHSVYTPEKNGNLSPERTSHFQVGCHNNKQATRNKNVYNQSAIVNGPKNDAVSIPITERGTVC